MCGVAGIYRPGGAGLQLHGDAVDVQGVRGDLDAERVRGTVRAHINEVRYCHQQALRRDPKAGGRVAIQFTISADGKVRQSAVAESTLRDPADAECIAKAFRRWLFPRPEGGGSVEVTYPFVLDPG